MKSGFSFALLAVLAFVARTVTGGLTGDAMSPVTRVVQLLQDLQKLCEENLVKDEKAFEKYKCWATTTQNVKKASNEKAQARVDSLETYIADLEAGRIELTSERVDLEKEIASLTTELENAEALREKEKEDFEAAKDETEKAISALDEAIEVLQEAQPGGKKSGLISVHSSTAASRAADFEKLTSAVEFGRRFLSKGDAMFLERVLTADVPEWDWKKLNRKAAFKMTYKTRTEKIVQTLKNLKFTFTQTLEDMEKKEKQAQETYDKLKESKEEQKGEAEDALGSMSLEGAARGQTKEEAEQEVKDLKEQIKNDENFIEQAKTDLKDKEGEFLDRKKIRMEETEAISKAIEVLHNDDARDLFKRSLKSQGYVQISAKGLSFFQESSHLERLRRSAPKRAAAVIARTAAQVGQPKELMGLVQTLNAAPAPAPAVEVPGDDKFDKVIEKIDDIIQLLKDEEDSDLRTKEECETARMEDTRESIVLARKIDELSDTITTAKAKIEEIEGQIEEKREEERAIEEELAAAKEIREEEKAAHAKSDKDDEDAAATIEQAKDVLVQFYRQYEFIQQTPSNDYVVAAGEAPPPPPKTWEDPYSGRQKENAGIVAILSMLKDDIDRDRVKAQDAEDKAQKAYDEFKTESDDQVKALGTAITNLESDKATEETTVEDSTKERNSKKGELSKLIKKIKDLQPGCDYMLVNYVIRSAKRKIEIDGLEKAKAVLKGAEFDESDPDRQLKPGDALLQK